MKFTKISLITTFVPTIIMLMFALVSFTNIFTIEDGKGLFVIGLLLIFPLLFIGQGCACAFGKGNLLLAVAVSTLSFFSIILLFLNSSALFYIILYLIVAFFAYGITLFSQKIQNQAKNNTL
ncbi:hypothetical protein [Anaerobacillus arseniciselenatis]|nr:hypothetical protein [Anaerobacillus arseniciselenatis]